MMKTALCTLFPHFLHTNRSGQMGKFKALQFISEPRSYYRTKHDYSTVEVAATKSCELYEKAIVALNGLQTNASVLKKSVSQPHNSGSLNLVKSENYLIRSGVSLEELDRLSVIHVSGTKGKGSTCAVTESILRAHGYKTGFYSSPHLVSATERIRLCGNPISQNDFAKYFWRVYNALFDKRESEDDMPPYFKFLTLMAFHVFLEENVDVAIIEVGIGGEYDCTNILKTTKTVGITSLGLEHTNLLGNTLESIAWQKAGIIKPGAHVFTVAQPSECRHVIEERCVEKNAKLFIVPDYDRYSWNVQPKLIVDNDVQKMNTSLALQLSFDWMRRIKKELPLKNGYTMSTAVTEVVRAGVDDCFWPGRCQLLNYKQIRFFLDGAHTIESINICMDWFLKETKTSKNPRFLVFNVTGFRDSTKLLQMLHDNIQFEEAIFVPNISSLKIDSADTKNLNNPVTDQLQRSNEHCRFWRSFKTTTANEPQAVVLNSLVEVIDHLSKRQTELKGEIDVLTTGSLHLIGAMLLALEEIDDG